MRFPEENSGLNHFHYLLARSFLVLLFLAARPLNAQTQGSLVHSISLQSGYFYLVNRDDMESPMRYSGGSLPLTLSYDYKSDIHRHSLRFSYRNCQLESAIASNGNHQGKEIGGTIEYAYFHKISIVEERMVRTSIGGAWENSADFIKYQYSAGKSSYGVLGYSSLSVSGLVEYKCSERGMLNARLSVPLVAFALRPGWAVASPVPNESPEDLLPIEDHVVHLILKGGRTVSWSSFRALSFSLGYDFALTPSWDFSTRYAFQYSYYTWPVPIRTVIGQLDVGLSMKY